MGFVVQEQDEEVLQLEKRCAEYVGDVHRTWTWGVLAWPLGAPDVDIVLELIYICEKTDESQRPTLSCNGNIHDKAMQSRTEDRDSVVVV
jgi:hypothetical protein